MSALPKILRALTITLFSCIGLPCYALPKHVSLDGFMVLEDVSNFNGGIKNGSVFNGILHEIVNYDFTKYDASARAGFLAITYTQNQSLYTGALQNVSNLSAQREIRIGELNVFKKFNSWSDLRVGIMDMREYLNIYDVPKELINSGFGTNRVMSNSTNVATYPYPGFGAVANFNREPYGLGLAIFQGDPQHQNTLFHHGAFFLEELNWQTKLAIKYKPDFYIRLGTWQYYQPDPIIGYSNIGVYLMGQCVWNAKTNREVSMIAQVGYGDKKSNIVPYSVAAGITASGVIPSRPKDKLSFGFSEIWIRRARPEIVFEINYNIYLLNYLSIKPDLQYIVRPNGTLPNAFAGILRLIYNINGHLLQRH